MPPSSKVALLSSAACAAIGWRGAAVRFAVVAVVPLVAHGGAVVVGAKAVRGDGSRGSATRHTQPDDHGALHRRHDQHVHDAPQRPYGARGGTADADERAGKATGDSPEKATGDSPGKATGDSPASCDRDTGAGRRGGRPCAVVA